MVGGRAAKAKELEAVVRVGACSGVLVRPDVVLTSAHCIEGAPDSVTVGGRDIRVAACRVHPRHAPGEAAHDIGYCRLAEGVAGAGIPLDDSAGELGVGARVRLAGFGQSGPFARDPGILRVVDTTVRAPLRDGVEVGTDELTACRGDSGAPVLVERDGELRVAGIVHGGSAATCASPAIVTAIKPHAAWLEDASRPTRLRDGSFAFLLVTGLVLASLLIARALRRRQFPFSRVS